MTKSGKESYIKSQCSLGVRQLVVVDVAFYCHSYRAGKCLENAFNTAADTIRDIEDEVLNYFINRATNASAESLNSKIKQFRAQLRGVIDVDFFLYRLSMIYG